MSTSRKQIESMIRELTIDIQALQDAGQSVFDANSEASKLCDIRLRLKQKLR